LAFSSYQLFWLLLEKLGNIFQTSGHPASAAVTSNFTDFFEKNSNFLFFPVTAVAFKPQF
jgi:hypothetical protein